MWNSYAIARQVDAPAEVYLLHVGKETGVETTHLAVDGGAHEEGGTAGPEDVERVVVLPAVGLEGPEEAPAAEGVAVAVDESAGGSGIFEFLGFSQRPYFGLAGSHVGVTLDKLEQRLEPVGRHLHVGVEQHCIFVVQFVESPVVPLGKTVVAGEGQQEHLGKFAGEEFDRVVGRAVVGHHDVGQMSRRVSTHRGEEALQ